MIRELDGKVDEGAERAAVHMELADKIVGEENQGGGD